MVILGVDLGKARTGVAVCDKSELLASPVEVVNEHNRERLFGACSAACQKRAAPSRSLSVCRATWMAARAKARRTRALSVRSLRKKTGLPVDFSDERGTTITAHGFLNETNTRGKRRKATVDAVAATIILQDYLDYRRNRKG